MKAPAFAYAKPRSLEEAFDLVERPGAKVLAGVIAGFALAAVQLLPTWELKQLSQRAAEGSAHDPGYGHIPPWSSLGSPT